MAMPAMDGPETVKRIRQDTRLKNMPVIGLTHTGNDEERLQASEYGVNDFLTRPVAPGELKSLLDRYFQVTTAQDYP
jgi:CheY-like chemotaxis protein